jgi:hypothetical protein
MPPNKEMKLTSVEHIGRSQLISSVRQTVRECHQDANEAAGLSESGEETTAECPKTLSSL